MVRRTLTARQSPCSAQKRAMEDTHLLEIAKADFERLVATERQLVEAVTRISHQRAIGNLSARGTDDGIWAKIASRGHGSRPA